MSCSTFTVAIETKIAAKIGLKKRNCHFGPNLRLVEIDFFKIYILAQLNTIDFELKKVLLPPREFCRHILS